MADGTFVLNLLSPGWCRLVHIIWGDSKDGCFKKNLFGKFCNSFFGKQCLCLEENASIERVYPFPDIDVKSATQCVQSLALTGGGLIAAWDPT